MKYNLSDIKYKILQLDKPANYQEYKNYLAQIIDKSITELTFPSWMEVTAIDDQTFRYCYSLTSVTIPDGVTRIGEMAFCDCGSLTSITIPDSVTRIAYEAFNNTKYYRNSSNWEDNVLYIGNHLIEAKSSLSGSYTIKENTKVVADNAFGYCENLTSVTIPDSVTSIGSAAMCYCTDVYIQATTPPIIIDYTSFYSATTIHVPMGSGDAYRNATNWSQYADKIVEDIEI